MVFGSMMPIRPTTSVGRNRDQPPHLAQILTKNLGTRAPPPRDEFYYFLGSLRRPLGRSGDTLTGCWSWEALTLASGLGGARGGSIFLIYFLPHLSLTQCGALAMGE